MTSSLLQSLVTTASVPKGTYAGVKVSPLNKALKSLISLAVGDMAGERIRSEKLHMTVIYSLKYVDPAELKPALELVKLPITAEVCGADRFDSLPKADGTRDPNSSVLVLKLKCPELLQVHAALKELGCTHTYPELSPHMSLYYGVEREACGAAVERLNQALSLQEHPPTIELVGLYAEPIQESWGKKATK